jgi:hypothetical protein
MVVGTGFLTFLWSLIVIFFMVTFFILLFHVIGDLFRRKDASGGKKALWVIFLVVAPYLGLLVYYIANGDGMAHRTLESAKQSQDAFDSYVRDVAGGSADQIAKAKQLLDSGAISQAEFEQLKAKALG